MDKTVSEKIRQIVAVQLKVEIEDVKPESKFVDDLGADSLDAINIVMALEETFDIEIPDDKAYSVATVAEVIKYIEDRVSGKPSA